MSDFRDEGAVRIIRSPESGTTQAITVVVIRDKRLRDIQNTGVHVYAGSLPYARALDNVARDLGAESGDTYTAAQMEDIYDIDIRYQSLRTA